MSGQKYGETGTAEGSERMELELMENWSWGFAGEVTWESGGWGERQQEKMGWQWRWQSEF